MLRGAQLVLVFILGGVIGFLASEKLSSQERLTALADRVSALEAQALAARALPPAAPKVDAPLPAPAAAPPRPAPAAPALARQVSLDGAPVRGRADAPVTIVEFSDFQCPFCSRAHPTLLRVLETYPDSVRLVFKHNPLGFHRDAPLAHRATLAADLQGRFWEMHDKIFANGRDLSRPTLIEHAKELELDIAKFTEDLDSEKLIAALDREVEEASQLGVTGTPTFFINGKILAGAQPYENFKALIDRELARVSRQ